MLIFLGTMKTNRFAKKVLKSITITESEILQVLSDASMSQAGIIQGSKKNDSHLNASQLSIASSVHAFKYYPHHKNLRHSPWKSKQKNVAFFSFFCKQFNTFHHLVICFLHFFLYFLKNFF